MDFVSTLARFFTVFVNFLKANLFYICYFTTKFTFYYSMVVLLLLLHISFVQNENAAKTILLDLSTKNISIIFIDILAGFPQVLDFQI